MTRHRRLFPVPVRETDRLGANPIVTMVTEGSGVTLQADLGLQVVRGSYLKFCCDVRGRIWEIPK